MSQPRIPEFEIHPLFAARWSPRAFSDAAMTEPELLSLFEAARWAPSSYNSQPWRFVYALRGDAHWQALLGLLIEFNRGWAQRAAALVIVLSKTSFIPPGKTEAITTGSHAFDAGAAWAQLALQAAHSGWAAHAMGGFDKQKAREVLGVPEGYDLEVAIAIGKPGDKNSLPDFLRAQESPNARRPVSELVARGVFDFDR